MQMYRCMSYVCLPLLAITISLVLFFVCGVWGVGSQHTTRSRTGYHSSSKLTMNNGECAPDIFMQEAAPWVVFWYVCAMRSCAPAGCIVDTDTLLSHFDVYFSSDEMLHPTVHLSVTQWGCMLRLVHSYSSIVHIAVAELRTDALFWAYSSVSVVEYRDHECKTSKSLEIWRSEDQDWDRDWDCLFSPRLPIRSRLPFLGHSSRIDRHCFRRQHWQVELAMSMILHTEISKLLENPGKNYYGADVGPRSTSEKLRRMFSLKRRDYESSAGIDRQNQWLRHEFWTERAR